MRTFPYARYFVSKTVGYVCSFDVRPSKRDFVEEYVFTLWSSQQIILVRNQAYSLCTFCDRNFLFPPIVEPLLEWRHTVKMQLWRCHFEWQVKMVKTCCAFSCSERLHNTGHASTCFLSDRESHFLTATALADHSTRLRRNFKRSLQ